MWKRPHLVSPLLAALSSIALAMAPAAATTTHADPLGSCNGLIPCFTTVQAAVDDSAAPATVFIFPGTYAESVLLNDMDSGNPGGISLVSVDALGAPTIATATIAAPTGSAIDTLTSFPGSITIDGLLTSSPDDWCIQLLGVGANVTLHDVTCANGPSGRGIRVVHEHTTNLEIDGATSNGSGDHGFRLHREAPAAAGIDGGDTTLRRLVADDNNFDGVNYLIEGDGGTVTLEDATLTASGSDGADIRALLVGVHRDVDIEVIGSALTANDGQGLLAITGGSVTASHTDASANLQRGLAIDAIGDATVSATTIHGVGDHALDIESDGAVTIRDFVATSPGLSGIWITGETSQASLLDIHTASITDAGDAAIQIGNLAAGAHKVACFDSSSNTVAAFDLLSAVTIDASDNYWGDPTGPTHPSNPGGLGDVIVDGANGGAGAVTFAPFSAVSCTMFSDGFESGDTLSWTSTTP